MTEDLNPVPCPRGHIPVYVDGFHACFRCSRWFGSRTCHEGPDVAGIFSPREHRSVAALAWNRYIHRLERNGPTDRILEILGVLSVIFWILGTCACLYLTLLLITGGP